MTNLDGVLGIGALTCLCDPATRGDADELSRALLRSEEAAVEHRERYAMQISCPQCEKLGRIVWAEDETPVDSGSLERAPKLLSPGFHPGPDTDRVGNPMVY